MSEWFTASNELHVRLVCIVNNLGRFDIEQPGRELFYAVLADASIRAYVFDIELCNCWAGQFDIDDDGYDCIVLCRKYSILGNLIICDTEDNIKVRRPIVRTAHSYFAAIEEFQVYLGNL